MPLMDAATSFEAPMVSALIGRKANLLMMFCKVFQYGMKRPVSS